MDAISSGPPFPLSRHLFPNLLNQIPAPPAVRPNPPSYPESASAATVNPMPSQRQIDANRRNAQHSTGPRTPEGRAAVGLNALRHGLSAQTSFSQAKTPTSSRNSSTPFSPNTSPPDPPKPCSSSKWPSAPGACAACAPSKPVCSMSECRNCLATRMPSIPVRAPSYMTPPAPAPLRPCRATRPASSAPSTAPCMNSIASASRRPRPIFPFRQTPRHRKMISPIKPNPRTGRPTPAPIPTSLLAKRYRPASRFVLSDSLDHQPIG